MDQRARNIVILGSTGSIGRSTLEVVAAAPTRFKVVGLTANQRLEELLRQSRELRPKWIVATDRGEAQRFDWSKLPLDCQILIGHECIADVVSRNEVDVVVAAIVGSAGLQGTWAALSAGKTVALANKETLVMAGPLVMELEAKRGGRIIPVDSEHSAIFQALQAGRPQDVRRIVLTASGGPFRRHSAAQFAQVTVSEALAHPTWSMGPKITVDSATMMNKALEVIEARWLFNLDPSKIEVVIHPQSIVHSMVEFEDGSVLAQLSPPDMKLPIQYALTHPERHAGPAARMDWAASWRLDFEPPDRSRFPALDLGFEVARAGGTTGAVLNAANEAAVAGFLTGQLEFVDIVPACRAVLEQHHYDSQPTLDDLLKLDTWAREEVTRWACT